MSLQRVKPFLLLATVGILGLVFTPGQARALLSETAAPSEPEMKIPDLPSQYQGWQHEYRDLVIPRQDLLFTNFQRPGKSAAIYDGKGLYQARFFNYQSDIPRVFIPVAGPGSSTESSYGGVMHYSGFENLTLDAGYVGGQLKWADEDQVFNPRPGQQADSWNMAGTGHWWDRTLSTRLEYARSALQPPTLVEQDAVLGQAIQAEMSVASGEYLTAGWFDRWVGTARYRSVDQDYYSLGNMELLKGLNTAQLMLQSELNGIGLTLDWLQEGNCPPEGCSRFEPTVNRAGMRVHYKLDQLQLPLFGVPILGARYYQVDRWQPEAAINRQGFTLLQNHDEAGVNLLFRQPSWHWSLDYQVSDQDHWREYLDANSSASMAQPSDWLHETVLFDLGWRFNRRFHVNMNARWHEQQELDPAIRYQYRNLGVQAHLGKIMRNLSVDMGYFYGYEANNIDNRHDLDTRFRTHTGNTQITWQLQSLQGGRPALDLYLRSSFNQHLNAGAALEELQWAASLGFQLSWGQY